MRIAVCDDEAILRYELKKYLSEYQSERAEELYITEFKSGDELLSRVEGMKPFDLIFMDYQMEGSDGLETARRLSAMNIGTKIVFLSAYRDIVFKTFEVSAFRFLVKPIEREPLFKALDDYRASVAEDTLLVIHSRDDDLFVRLSEIVYVEAKEKYSVIRTTKGLIDTKKAVKDIEEMLPPDRFIRCHKTYITSFSHIVSHSIDEITYDNGEKAKIGKVFAKSFKTELQKYILKHNSRSRKK